MAMQGSFGWRMRCKPRIIPQLQLIEVRSRTRRPFSTRPPAGVPAPLLAGHTLHASIRRMLAYTSTAENCYAIGRTGLNS